MWKVEGNQVMPEQEVNTVSERVQLLQRSEQISLPVMQGRLRAVTTQGSKTVNSRITHPDLKVDGKATRRKIAHG